MTRWRAATAWTGPRLPAILAVVITAGTLGIIMAISYAHEFGLAARNGQGPWEAKLIPFPVDGMLVVASVAIYWAGQRGIRRPWQPMTVAAVGMLATIAANFVSDDRASYLGPAVAGSVGVAAVLVGWVAHWMIDTQRKLAAGEDPQPARNCSCPPPPTTLAEALPGARQRLRDDGKKFGEQELADRFATTRHEVRKVFTPAVATGPIAGNGLPIETNGHPREG